jgi:hypothetical protein
MNKHIITYLSLGASMLFAAQPMSAASTNIKTPNISIRSTSDSEQKTSIVKIADVENGIIKVFNGVDEVKSGEAVPQKTTLTIEVRSVASYAITAVTANGVALDTTGFEETEDLSKYSEPEIYSYYLTDQDVVISATFEPFDYENVSGTVTASQLKRYVTTIQLVGPTDTSSSATQSVSVGHSSENHESYADCTATKLTVIPGGTYTVGVSEGSGEWSHGYFFIDYNNDGVFTPAFLYGDKAQNTTSFGDATDDAFLLTSSSELVSFNGYCKLEAEYRATSELFEQWDDSNYGLKVFYGSDGVKLNSTGYVKVVTTLPSFTIPDDLAPGTYTARYMHRWNSIDASGKEYTGGAIGTDAYCNLTEQGGTIIDFLIEVVRPNREVKVSVREGQEKVGDVAIGNTVSLDVTTDGDVRMQAHAAFPSSFMGWTDDSGKIVSKDEIYTYRGASAANFTANFGYKVKLSYTTGGSASVTSKSVATKSRRHLSAVTSTDDDSSSSIDNIIISEDGESGVFLAENTVYLNLDADEGNRLVSIYYVDTATNVRHTDVYATDATKAEDSVTSTTVEMQLDDPYELYITYWDINTGVSDIAVDAPDLGEPEYFTLTGVRVAADNLTPGIYLRRIGNTTEKIVVK